MGLVETDTAGARILVVDDEPSIADVLALALRHEHYEVAVASGGEEALAKAAEWRPALIVLDALLPDLDGFEVTRRIRADGEETPILFLSARDSIDDRVRGLELGADGYVTKPFSVEELLSRIRSLLRRGGSSTAQDRSS